MIIKKPTLFKRKFKDHNVKSNVQILASNGQRKENKS